MAGIQPSQAQTNPKNEAQDSVYEALMRYKEELEEAIKQRDAKLQSFWENVKTAHHGHLRLDPTLSVNSYVESISKASKLMTPIATHVSNVVYRTTNGKIIVGKDDITFKPVERTIMASKFGYKDAYAMIWHAVRDQRYLPPNAIEVTGSKEEREILAMAVEKYNQTVPLPQRLILSNAAEAVTYDKMKIKKGYDAYWGETERNPAAATSTPSSQQVGTSSMSKDTDQSSSIDSGVSSAEAIAQVMKSLNNNQPANQSSGSVSAGVSESLPSKPEPKPFASMPWGNIDITYGSAQQEQMSAAVPEAETPAPDSTDVPKKSFLDHPTNDVIEDISKILQSALPEEHEEFLTHTDPERGINFYRANIPMDTLYDKPLDVSYAIKEDKIEIFSVRHPDVPDAIINQAFILREQEYERSKRNNVETPAVAEANTPAEDAENQSTAANGHDKEGFQTPLQEAQNKIDSAVDLFKEAALREREHTPHAEGLNGTPNGASDHGYGNGVYHGVQGFPMKTNHIGDLTQAFVEKTDHAQKTSPFDVFKGKAIMVDIGESRLNGVCVNVFEDSKKPGTYLARVNIDDTEIDVPVAKVFVEKSNPRIVPVASPQEPQL